MRCLPWLNLACDKPYWITRSHFLNYFDQADFELRDRLVVLPVYLAEWFHFDDHGVRMFILPTVQCVDGRTQFINGRHRTAVLLATAEVIPIALVEPFRIDEKAYLEITSRPINTTEYLELPDLTIQTGLSGGRS